MYSGTGVWDGQAYWQSMTRWKYSGSEIFVGFKTTAHLKHESCGENGNVFPCAPVDCGSTTEHRRLPAASGLSRHPCQPIAAPRSEERRVGTDRMARGRSDDRNEQKHTR